MCTTCGCGQHEHLPGGSPGLAQAGLRRLRVERDLLARNDALAADNRRLWRGRGLLVLNLLSSPGSGKTTLLVETIRRLQGSLAIGVIEGDQQSRLDADRIRAVGVPAVQINTGQGCYLDAHRVGHAAQALELGPGALLFIENVGNLVCPARFDLGEAGKVLVLSVTEGDDKPWKYPDMFAAADLLLINKLDLLPHVDFDLQRCLRAAREVRPGLPAIALSARTGENLEAWLAWLAWLRGQRSGLSLSLAGG